MRWGDWVLGALVFVPLAAVALLGASGVGHVGPLLDPPDPSVAVATLADIDATDARIDEIEGRILAASEKIAAQTQEIEALRSAIAATKASLARATSRPHRKSPPDPPASSHLRFQ